MYTTFDFDFDFEHESPVIEKRLILNGENKYPPSQRKLSRNRERRDDPCH